MSTEFAEATLAERLRSAGASLTVAERLRAAGPTLTAAERRVAKVLTEQPQLVGFRTAAEVAKTSEAGASSVVRLAMKIGFEGFGQLQLAVQDELSQALSRSSQHVQKIPSDDIVSRHAQLELRNVSATLEAVDTAVLGEAVKRIGNLDLRVDILAADASNGVARQFMTDLYLFRDDVWLLDGNDVSVKRNVARMRSKDVLVVIALNPYDRWLVELMELASLAKPWILGITDSILSPVAELADRAMVVSSAGLGAFDSHVGTLALCNLIVTGVAGELRTKAAERLEEAELKWQSASAFIAR